MASSGSFNTSNYEGRYLQFAWSIPEDGQSISGNKTKINWTLTGKGAASAGYYMSGNFKVVIDGNIVFQSSTRIQLRDGTLVASGSVTLSHNSDGTRTFSASAEAGIYYYDVNCSGSGSWTLPTIARASTISSVSTVTLGNQCSVKWTPKHSSFGYKLQFSLGNWSYTTGAITPKTTGSYTYTGYTVPLVVANQLPNSKTGTMTVKLYSYTSSACTTQIGSADSATFTVKIPSNSYTKPTVTMDIEPVSSLGSAFSSLYIQGLSKVKATITAEGKYEASIASKKLYVLGKSYGSPYQSGYIASSGQVTVKARATDSRGYYNDYEEEITVIPYKKPSILPASGESGIVCARCDASGELTESGTYLRIIAKRSYSKVLVDDVQKNFCEIRYRYRAESTTTFSDWVTLLEKSDISSNTIDSGAIAGVVPSTQISYVVQVGVVDDIGEADAVQFIIPTDFITINCPESYKGRRMGIFRYVDGTDEDGLYVGLPIFGGSVDSLLRGTRITATEAAPISLNDIKTPGCYYSPNADNSQYIADSPYTSGGFRLEVRELQSTAYIRQTMQYGRTTITRHWNGETWSDWMRYLCTTESSATVADYVVEQGSINGWRYKKWKSGNYQMYGYFTVTTTVAGTEYGSMYYSEQFALPTPFSIYSAVVSGSALSWFIVISGGKASTDPDNNVAFRLFRPTSFDAGQTINVRLNVVGTLN